MNELYTQVQDLRTNAFAFYAQGRIAHQNGVALFTAGKEAEGRKLIAQSRKLARKGAAFEKKADKLAKELH
jgi:hypothetical protein